MFLLITEYNRRICRVEDPRIHQKIRERPDRSDRHQLAASALLRCLIGDLLPARSFCRRLFHVIAHHDMLRFNRIDPRCAKLRRLLHDEVHLLPFEQCLRKEYLDAARFFLHNIFCKSQGHSIACSGGHRHACCSAVCSGNNHSISDLRAHNSGKMMRIPARNANFLCKFPCIKQPPHQFLRSEVRRMIIAAHSFSQVISSTVKPCCAAACSTSAIRSSMMPEASRVPPGARWRSS